jgi:C-lobe and N-lobe beta barrels of Tf-binding protein B
MTPNTTAVMPGISQTGRGSASAVQLDPVSTNSLAKLNIGPDGKVIGMSLLAPASSAVFAPGTANCRPLGACAAGDTEKTGVVLNPSALGWDYQTFGVWAINGAPLQVGAISAGAVTPATAVPTVGSATFTGHAGGFYFDGTGGRLTTDAQMSALTNFSNRSIQFSTTGTMVSTAANPPATTARPELNLSGNLSYAPGSSQFSGNVSTANNALSGNASGRFYGPNAQEIGGVYGLSAPSGGARMIGGFGGKQ